MKAIMNEKKYNTNNKNEALLFIGENKILEMLCVKGPLNSELVRISSESVESFGRDITSTNWRDLEEMFDDYRDVGGYIDTELAARLVYAGVLRAVIVTLPIWCDVACIKTNNHYPTAWWSHHFENGVTIDFSIHAEDDHTSIKMNRTPNWKRGDIIGITAVMDTDTNLDAEHYSVVLERKGLPIDWLNDKKMIVDELTKWGEFKEALEEYDLEKEQRKSKTA